MEKIVYDIDEIKLQAEVCTIYTADNQEGARGVIHMVGKQAIYCHPIDGGYVWTINGERVRESAVQNALSAHQQ